MEPDYCEGCNQRFAPIDQQLCWGCKDGELNSSKRGVRMKTPEENKCGMECIRSNASRICVKTENGQCPRCEQLAEETLARIHKLESTYSQVSKALYGKENATLEELLQAVDQLKTNIAQVERERDALLYDARGCSSCVYKNISIWEPPCNKCVNTESDEHYKWRRVCKENSQLEWRSQLLRSVYEGT